MKANSNMQGLLCALIAALIYVFTIHPVTKAYTIYALIASLIYMLSILFFKKEHSHTLIYSMEAFILLLVGLTGWFFSPFFNWLYLIVIALAFIFNVLTASLFVAVLIALFLPAIALNDWSSNLLTLVALISVLPISYFLRSEYLKLKENEKNILILQEKHKEYKSKVSELLDNKLVRIGVELREPLVDIKQIATFSKAVKSEKLKSEEMTKIISLSNAALAKLNHFEEETTGVKLDSLKK